MLRDMSDEEPGSDDLIARLVDVCAADDRIAAVFLGGSRAAVRPTSIPISTSA